MAAWESAPLVQGPKTAPKANNGRNVVSFPLDRKEDDDPGFSASLDFDLGPSAPDGAAWQSAPLVGERPMPKRAKTVLEQGAGLVGTGPGKAAIGAAETGLSMASGMAGQIAGGFAGLGVGAANMLRGRSFEDAFGGEEAAGAVRGVQEALTYQPRSEAGQFYSRLAGLPMKYASEATGAAGEKIAGSAGRSIGEALPAVAATLYGGATSLRAASEAAVEGAAARPVTPKQEVTQMAQDAGYVFPPKDLPEAGVVGRTLQAVGGKVRTEQTASIRNQTRTNDFVKEDLGIPKSAVIDKESLAEVTKRATEPYRKLEAVTTPFKTTDKFRSAISGLAKPLQDFGDKFPNIVKNDDLQGMVKDLSKEEFSPAESVFIIRRLREQGNANMAASRIKPDATKTELARAQLKAAGAMEDLVEERLGETGQAGLLKDFREGRRLYAKAMQIAKITDASGNVNASMLSKAIEKGVPLDGNMRKVGQIAAHYPKAMASATKLGGEEGLTVFDTWIAGAELASGHALGAAAVLLRPTIRGRLALGPMGQKAATPSTPLPQLAPGAAQAALAAPSGSSPPMVTMGGSPVAQDPAQARALALQRGDPRMLPMSATSMQGQ